MIRFVVNKLGKVAQIETIIKDNDTLSIKAATDVIRNMLDWILAQLKGESVSVYFTIPFRVRLKN